MAASAAIPTAVRTSPPIVMSTGWLAVIGMLPTTTDDTSLAAAALTIAWGADGRDDARCGTAMRRLWFLCTRTCRFPAGGLQTIARHEPAGPASAPNRLAGACTVIGAPAARAAMGRFAARVPVARTVARTSPKSRFRDSRPKQGILPPGSDPGAPR